MNWYLHALKNYAVFGGRARRSEYWFFILFNALIHILLSVIDRALGTYNPESFMGLFGVLYALAVVIPGIAVTVRRLHDVGRSGAWFFILFVPFVGFFIFLFFAVQDSVPGPNKYGPNPKQLFQ